METNWFGLEPHPTDRYSRWTGSSKERVATAEKYRAAYDKIIAAGLKDELDILTEGAYEEGRTDEWEASPDSGI